MSRSNRRTRERTRTHAPIISGATVEDDVFGNTNPGLMPPHFFMDALAIDYPTAVAADVSKQDFSVAPRYWYIDCRFACADCGRAFVWSADEQRVWFEEYRFFVDARPKHCPDCRAKRRHVLELQKEYDALVGEARARGSAEQKRRIVALVDELEALTHAVPTRMRETRDRFRQVAMEDPRG